jgi:hypothetical protein
VRLVTRKLWRAFPELDRFDDDQCRRFVDAACSRQDLQVVRGLCCGVAAVLVLTIPWTAGWADDAGEYFWGWPGAGLGKWFESVWWYRPFWFAALVGVGMLLLAALAAGMTRDVLLRRRVKQVMVSHGSCSACTYFLGGLPVNEYSLVMCPECGASVRVDSALIELAPGGATFAPTMDNVRSD